MRLRWKKHKKPIILTLVIIVIIATLLAVLAYRQREIFIRYPLVSHLVPFYRSLTKLPDLLFLPRYAFFHSQLETYQLSVPIKKIRELDLALPVPFSGGELEDDNKVWVTADFKTSDYQGQVKVRYRGTIANHWNSYKKSFLIKFPKENLFHGIRELNLVIPDDRDYFVEPLNNYRAKKLGLIVPDSHNVRLELNGVDHGVYLSFEHWTQEWIEKQQIASNSLILGIGQTYLGTTSDASIFTPEGVIYWKSWNSMTPDLDAVRALNEIVSKADDETFQKIIPHIVDINGVLAANVINLLSGGFHGSGDSPAGANNTVVIFDGSIGKFRPVPYNVVTVSPENSYQEYPSSLERRILAIPEWKEARNRLFKDYSAKNNQDDLRFIEKWIKENNDDFLADQSKLINNFSYLKTIKNLTKTVKFYQNNADKHLNDKYPIVPRLSGGIHLPEGFNYLWEVIKTPEQFVAEHPEFYLTDEGLILGGGPHYFFETIIVPTNTKLTILPGATLWMGPKVSFVSYSPVWAVGTKASPIRILPSNSQDPWGNFVVIDTGRQKNTLDHIFVSRGGESTINGIYVSGALAFHGSDVNLTNSYLEKAQGDDTVNVKSATGIIKDNIFDSNSSDGIDLDFPDAKTVIEGNRFFNSGGDAVDLSWSNVLIKDNIMISSGDKGISVGERSKPTIVGNLLAKNAIGVAIKDFSEAVMNDNIIIKNKIGLMAYEKKAWFGGGQAVVRGGFLWGNDIESQIDKLSKIDFINVKKTEPNLQALPYMIRELVK